MMNRKTIFTLGQLCLAKYETNLEQQMNSPDKK